MTDARGFLVESRPVTATWPASDGMVRCQDCRNLCGADDRGIQHCSQAWRPAVVVDKWRRCRLYGART